MNRVLSYVSLIILSSLSLSIAPSFDNLKFENSFMIYTYYHKARTGMISVRKRAIIKLSYLLKEIFQIDKVNLSNVEYVFQQKKMIIKVPFQTFQKLNLS